MKFSSEQDDLDVSVDDENNDNLSVDVHLKTNEKSSLGIVGEVLNSLHGDCTDQERQSFVKDVGEQIKKSRIIPIARSISEGIIEGLDDEIPFEPAVIDRKVALVDSNSKSVESDDETKEILARVESSERKNKRKPPKAHEVESHKQRYYTKNGMIIKEKAPYSRGQNNDELN